MSLFSKSLLVSVVSAVVVAVPAAAIPQPQVVTGAAQPVVGAAVYVVPYAVSNRTTGAAEQEATIVTVGNPSATLVCDVQVEWLDWNNAPAGVSGPFVLAPGTTLEFTTLPVIANIRPFTLNIFRNAAIDFEGYARIRSLCPTTQRLRVNAQVARIVGPNLDPAEFIHIKVIKPLGNVGD